MNDKITDIKKLLLSKIQECYCITLNANEDILDEVAKNLENGIKLIQVEMGNIKTKEFIEISRKVHQLCSIYDALFIIKNRADLCHILQADGICLDDDELEVSQAIDIIGKEKLITRQINNPQNFNLEELKQINYIIQENNNSEALNQILEGSNLKIITIKR